MPNLIAYGALLAWPLVTLAIFALIPARQAVVWSLLLGYLLLPVRTAFDFPGVPALDKTSIANLSTLVGVLIFSKQPVFRLPREWWLLILMAVYVASPMGTVLSNLDPLIYGDVVLQGLRPYDAISTAAYKSIDLIPFILGYNLLYRPRARHEVLHVLAVAALSYSLLMLIEVRLSPQLHNWIYGFFPHSFEQQIRGDGFRPVVFLGHGLLVAIFTSMAVVSVGYFAKFRIQIFGISSWIWLIYLLTLLLLCRSLGALILALGALVIVQLNRGKYVAQICALGALIVLSYPILRGSDLVPVQPLADSIAEFSADRAGSFQLRIDNENTLLQRANQRPWLGWGGYGRNRVYDELTGKDLSVTDGTWIIIVGTYGWIGYLATFGLLSAPIIAATWQPRGRVDPSSTALALVLVINLLDLIPNSSLGPITWLLAGAIAAFKRSNERPRKQRFTALAVDQIGSSSIRPERASRRLILY